MYTTLGTYYFSMTLCCSSRTVVPPDEGSRYARNMWRLTKCKNKLCIKLVFLYTIEMNLRVSGRVANFLSS